MPLVIRDYEPTRPLDSDAKSLGAAALAAVARMVAIDVSDEEDIEVRHVEDPDGRRCPGLVEVLGAGPPLRLVANGSGPLPNEACGDAGALYLASVGFPRTRRLSWQLLGEILSYFGCLQSGVWWPDGPRGWADVTAFYAARVPPVPTPALTYPDEGGARLTVFGSGASRILGTTPGPRSSPLAAPSADGVGSTPASSPSAGPAGVPRPLPEDAPVRVLRRLDLHFSPEGAFVRREFERHHGDPEWTELLAP